MPLLVACSSFQSADMKLSKGGEQSIRYPRLLQLVLCVTRCVGMADATAILQMFTLLLRMNDVSCAIAMQVAPSLRGR